MTNPRVVTAISQDSRGLFLDFDDGSREFYRVRITHEHPDDVAIPSTLEQRMAAAGKEVGSWTQEKRDSMQLQGSNVRVALNQCDGCRVGASLNERGIHRYSDGSRIACTRDRYTP